MLGHCGRVEDDAFVVNGRIVRILGGCLTCLVRWWVDAGMAQRRMWGSKVK